MLYNHFEPAEINQSLNHYNTFSCSGMQVNNCNMVFFFSLIEKAIEHNSNMAFYGTFAFTFWNL